MDRREGGYVSGSQKDGHKVALLFEGGAMGGVVSAAFGVEISALGFSECFDTVYGTSSGALNAAFFVAKQAPELAELYLNDILDPQFMRILRWPDQVDVKWLAKRLSSGGPRSISVKNIMTARPELRISTTNITTGETRYFSNKLDSGNTIIPALTASGSTPMFVSHTEVIEGQAYSDGLVREAIPSVAAIEDGHTHIIALLSNPVGRQKHRNTIRSWLEQIFRIRHYPIPFQTAFHARAKYYNEAINLLHTHSDQHAVLVICPQGSDPKIGNLERDPAVLARTINIQRDRAHDVVSGDPSRAKFRALQKEDLYT